LAKHNRLILMAVVVLTIIVVGAGVASAAVGLSGNDGDDPPETQLATETALPEDEGQTTDTTTPAETTPTSDPDDPEDGEESTFGQIISALREAGDHTPAAIIMGKDVPGWDPEKHPGSTTDITAYPPGQDKGDDGDDPDDGDDDPKDPGDEPEDEDDTEDDSGGGSAKEHAPAGLEGKTVSGHSK
jgi:hypothetical protein